MPEFFEAYDLVNWQLDGGDWIGLAARIDSPSHPRHLDYAGPPVGLVFER
jgi:hypothetical protein